VLRPASVLLLRYDPERAKRVIVMGIAPAAYVIPGTCMEATHFIVGGDVVTTRDRVGRYLADDTIRQLPRHPKAPKWDHGLQSPTYQNATMARFDEILLDHGVGRKP